MDIQAFLVDWWSELQAQAALAGVHLPDQTPAQITATPLGRALALVAEAADDRLIGDEATLAQVRQAMDIVERGVCFDPTPAAGHVTLQFLLAQAQAWYEDDELIPLSRAAEIAGLSASNLVQRTYRGRLRAYRDPEAGIHDAKLWVLRSDVEALATKARSRRAEFINPGEAPPNPGGVAAN